ncbi:nucleoside deaminase [Microbacterium sp. No. 7]|uniref:nucleoside deaminase n=1 Tax=Microbacterium sp. No. 7 TaxID=1714373 RepID=UPI0006D00EDD|nr:nucleoside deaminase [Microbacterium sp. No. 7]ALJ22179.1 hypothetical protein AOA12_20755 [Microbacterium sp. No. 7]
MSARAHRGLEVLRDTVALATAAAAEGNAPFGAAVVRDDVVVALTANQVGRTGDPTAHAEVCAIRRACRALGTPDLSGALLYSSCEPCLMCASAAIWAGIDEVVYAAPITALTRYPIDGLFPPESVDWARLPLTRTLVPLDAAAAVLGGWRG